MITAGALRSIHTRGTCMWREGARGNYENPLTPEFEFQALGGAEEGCCPWLSKLGTGTPSPQQLEMCWWGQGDKGCYSPHPTHPCPHSPNPQDSRMGPE